MANPMDIANIPFDRDAELVEVFIEDLRLQAQIGVFAHEKGRTQPLVLTIHAWARVSPQNDDLDETANYKLFADAARDLAENNAFQLVESFLSALASKVFESDERIVATSLKAVKPEAIEHAAGAGARLFRARA